VFDKNKEWFVDQYNRNRSFKDCISSYEELKEKIKECLKTPVIKK